MVSKKFHKRNRHNVCKKKWYMCISSHFGFCLAAKMRNSKKKMKIIIIRKLCMLLCSATPELSVSLFNFCFRFLFAVAAGIGEEIKCSQKNLKMCKNMRTRMKKRQQLEILVGRRRRRRKKRKCFMCVFVCTQKHIE